MANLGLNGLLQGIGKAVKDAQAAVEAHSAYHFQRLLTEGAKEGADTAGGVSPVTVRLPFPKSDGTYEPREIPVAALMHHHSLLMEEVKVKFWARLGWDDRAGEVTVELAPPRKQDDETAAAAGVPSEIELVLKRGDVPEGTARTSMQLVKAI